MKLWQPTPCMVQMECQQSIMGPPRHNFSLDELQGLSLVGFEAGSAIRAIIDQALRDANVAMNVVMELRSIPGIS